MAARARSKIQRILNELNNEETEHEAAAAAAGVFRRSAAGNDAMEGGAVAARGNTLDFGLEQDISLMPPGGFNDTEDSSSFLTASSPTASSSLSSTPSDPRRQPQHQHQRPAHHYPAVLLERAAAAERRAQQLMAENRALRLGHAEATAAKQAEVEELRSHLAGTVRELQQRQQDLEASAPLMKLRLEDFRLQLADLRISDAVAKDLRLLPPAQRAPLDDIKLAVHEAVAESKAEAERLRTALAVAREAAARSEEASSKAKLEAARLAASLSERDRDLALVSEGLQARIERLASELESSMVAAQLGQAKAAMYDELKAQLDAAEAEKQRLQVVEATFKRLEKQATEERQAHMQREHGVEMLQMDKAYLRTQADLLADQLRKAEAELELRDKKINELTKHKTDLFEKLMSSEALVGRNEEGRLQRELHALQERTHADLEKIRVETAEAYEREARLLRELRDGAQDEAMRSKVALAELQAYTEKRELAHNEVTKRLEQQVVEMQTELKQRAFELSHFKVMVAEKEQLAGRANMQIELLQDKLGVLMDKYRALEVDHNSAVNKALQAAAEVVATSGRAGGAAGAGGRDGGGKAGGKDSPAGGSPTKVDMLLLKQERDRLAREVESLSERLRSAQDSLRLAAQPHAFLLSELEAVKARASQAEAKLAALQAALDMRVREVEALTAERDGMKGDLDTLLAQRMQLEGMKAIVVKALAGGLPQLQQAAAAAAAAGVAQRRVQGPFGQTTIVGEGRS